MRLFSKFMEHFEKVAGFGHVDLMANLFEMVGVRSTHLCRQVVRQSVQGLQMGPCKGRTLDLDFWSGRLGKHVAEKGGC